jgi:hypothetical protein
MNFLARHHRRITACLLIVVVLLLAPYLLGEKPFPLPSIVLAQ